MDSRNDQPAQSANTWSSWASPGQQRGRRAAALLAAGAPLAMAAALAVAPVVTAAAVPVVTAAAPAQARAAALLAARSLPASTAGSAVCNPCDPKIPTMVGD
jgi:cell envelope opacity-associated protein A